MSQHDMGVSEDELSAWKVAEASESVPVSAWISELADGAAARSRRLRSPSPRRTQLRSGVDRSVSQNPSLRGVLFIRARREGLIEVDLPVGVLSRVYSQQHEGYFDPAKLRLNENRIRSANEDPIFLRRLPGGVLVMEDGHHRAVRAVRQGRSTIRAVIYPYPSRRLPL